MSTLQATDQTFSIRGATIEQLKELIEKIRQSKSAESILITRIKELETQLQNLKKTKRYGLVWEDKVEDVAERCKRELPVLIRDEEKTVEKNPNGAVNLIIEGDNFHALSTLAYTHKGKVDVIYIDPPYNTGATDWKYNNDYVDSNDTFRHSKWLSMMNNRLKIAKGLLKFEGVLVLAIDENEVSHIGVLLEEIFNDHEIHKITVVHNPRGIQGTNISYTNEFLYFVFRKGLKVIGSRKIKQEDISWSNLRNWGGESFRTDAKNCFYSIIIDPKTSEILGFGDVPDDSFHVSEANTRVGDLLHIYPIDQDGIERKWRYARQSVEDVQHLLRARIKNKVWSVEIGKDFGTVRTVWIDSRYDANEYGTKLIGKIVPGTTFNFPKSLWAVYDSIAPIVSGNPNAVVLDFFAGSGTTGHAVLELNKEDGGDRQFILCTNNESRIAEEVTYPRIKNVIEGYADVSGIPANLYYYRTDFIDREKSLDDLRKRFIYRCSELLQIRESCFGEYQKDSWTQNFLLYENHSKILAILYSPLEIPRLEAFIEASDRPVSIYIFSMGSEIFYEELVRYRNRISIETIPDEILSTYQKIFGF